MVRLSHPSSFDPAMLGVNHLSQLRGEEKHNKRAMLRQPTNGHILLFIESTATAGCSGERTNLFRSSCWNGMPWSDWLHGWCVLLVARDRQTSVWYIYNSRVFIWNANACSGRMNSQDMEVENETFPYRTLHPLRFAAWKLMNGRFIRYFCTRNSH